MTIEIITPDTGTLDLSAQEIQALTNWPPAMIEDYQNQSQQVNNITTTLNVTFGSMALQDANNVDITGGNIVNVFLDNISAGTITVETLSITNSLTVASLETGDLEANGNVSLGLDGDSSLTINPSFITWNNPIHSGSHTFQGNVKIQGTLTIGEITQDSIAAVMAARVSLRA